MTRVKICGITNRRDALEAVEAGTDALGFVFAPSPRRITPDDARAIIKGLPPFVTTVGVFVDAATEEIEWVSAAAGVDMVQLHGQEPSEVCARCSRPVIKRIAVSSDDTHADLSARVQGYRASLYLLDPGAGSGETFRWELVRAVEGPLLVAGGLNPDNVKSLIQEVRPFGVDVSSGVEEQPGQKDPEKLRAFLRAVREQDLAADNTTDDA
ncbi:MAG: phosphoribosylanthranilate isomerase [Phycisphaerae bacterium]